MSNPNFIDRGGEYTFSPPYSAEKVDYYGFIVDADPAALRAMCDKYLNGPLGQSGRFIPAGAFVMFVGLQIGTLRSLTPPYNSWGWFVEKEMAVWVLLIDTQKDAPYWFFPYMWVDNPYAMANGREVYGFPKQFGAFNIPASPDQAEELKLSTLVMPTYSAATEATPLDLITITPTSTGQRGYSPEAIWHDMEALAKEMIYLLDDGLSLLGNAKVLLNYAEGIIQKHIPMVFLKEVRDAVTANAACFQQVVELLPQTTAFRSARLLKYEYDIDILKCDSHPLRSDFGLAPSGPIRSKFCLYMDFDFTLPLGTEIA